MKLLSLGLFVLFISSFISASHTTGQPVTFNGNWQNGVTLYSDKITLTGSFMGKNTYPLGKVCTPYTKEYTRRVCGFEIVGYKEKIRRVCQRIGRSYSCHREPYQYPIRQVQCHTENYTKDYLQCSYSVPTKVACKNPNGDVTNALYYTNFEYDIDNQNNWTVIPTNFNNVTLNNEVVQFRVNIPTECSPEYDINKAVLISNN